MIDIFIKSFNRPFYLDRCISSIKMYVSGDYQITVLDDGTPETYLEKIVRKHPEVTIKRSENYKEKALAIQDNLVSGKRINGFNIPTKLWYDAAKSGSEYFIMTEDDVWFTSPVDLNILSNEAKANHIRLIKLGWLGNYNDDNFLTLKRLGTHLTAVMPPKLFLSGPMVMDWYFYNKFKFFTILYKAGLADNYTKRKYWTLNTILMGFWDKNYWLYIWKDAQGKVDEKQQLRNAAIFYRKHKSEENFITRLNSEAMKTTFKSSATNSYHQYGKNFDVNYFNHLLNEAWLNGDFDVMMGFPKDFPTEYFEKFLDDKVDREEMHAWIEKFKNQYKSLGCEVD